jgi:hypothetical protein
MTITVATNSATWQGNGATTSFPYLFALPAASQATLLYTTAAGLQTTVASGAYTITGVGQPTPGNAVQGGFVTYAPGGVPIPAGSTLTLIRTMPLLQSTALLNQAGLWPLVVEGALDNLELQIQQISNVASRAVVINPADTLPTTPQMVLPAAASRAGGVFGFDASGNFQLYSASGAAATTSANVSYMPPFSGSVPETVSARLGQTMSVKDFGAVGNGIVDDSAAFAAAVAAASNDWTILVPPGLYNIVTPPISSKTLVWQAEGAFQPNGSSILALPGVVRQSRGGIGYGRVETSLTVGATATDFAVQHVERITSYTGGTPGFVNSALRVDTVIGAGATAYEWAFTSVCNNNATAGQNVGGYLQGIKNSTGPTWGAVAEVIDTTGVANPTTGAVALEVDMTVNGTDSGFNRIGINIANRRWNTSGASSQGGYGLLINSGALTTGSWVTAIAIQDTVTVGIDMSHTNFTAGGFAMRLKTNAAIDMSGDGVNQWFWNGGALTYAHAGVAVAWFNTSGGIGFGQGITTLNGSVSTGAQTPTLGANKPGTAGGAPSTWLSANISGVQMWIPAWTN